ncbi:class I SAM-dependent RNA methyltransferase [Candidatus Saccharibacteria bacterium]|nr:class I SAM-dependent RNA methyltransferase [Candidatus Saccharibacteria bacterium]
MEEVTVEKLVHGGQGLGQLPDGRKVFVWNALPGEKVQVRLIKQKHSYAEGIAEEIITASPDRINPLEDNYLATSPWQMMTFAAENLHKSSIVRELFSQAHLDCGVPDIHDDSILTPDEFHYRNKMEYSFWGDDDGLHLALHQRGSHGKQIVMGSALALPAVDQAARAVLEQLQSRAVRAGDLKTIVVRCDQDGNAAAALFVKPNAFPRLVLPSQLKGLRVYHSNPKSPASVATKLLYELGDCRLQDTLLGQTFHYDVDSFFQVNLPVYERVLDRIRAACEGDPVDMYAGVGSIGLSVAKRCVELIELDPASAAMARQNISYMVASGSVLDARVVEASSEKVLEYIVRDRPLIVDPPRAGLHAKVVERCLEVKPPQIIYLSCNPATQARDLALLQGSYDLADFAVYNFFPRTPHIETLAVLRLRGAIHSGR